MSYQKREQIADGVTLYLGDCREILPMLPKADAIITDPPYGIFKKTGGDGKMFGKDTIYSIDDSAAQWDARPSKELLDLCISAADKFVIWGGNYLADHLGECRGPLIWNKLTGNNSYADGEIAWSNVTGTCRILTHQWCGAFKDSERGLRAEHPTQKPIAVMEWCISFVDGQVIIDPFMGSGTTGVAAIRSGRKFTGIEISPKYFDIARRRAEEEWRKPRMFTDPKRPAEQLDWAEMWSQPFDKPELLGTESQDNCATAQKSGKLSNSIKASKLPGYDIS